MIQVKSFVFNSFEENTYVLYDPTGACIIIDPGCHLQPEERELTDFIQSAGLKPVRLINTHCHIDHVLGNGFIAGKYQLALEIHEQEVPVLSAAEHVSRMYDIAMNPSPAPGKFIREGDRITFGNSELEVLFTPGHSPGSISFYAPAEGFVISGDVLFQRSIGRTDLPGGNYQTLMASIVDVLLPLGDDVVVHPGHGPATTLGEERKLNPFLREHFQD